MSRRRRRATPLCRSLGTRTCKAFPRKALSTEAARLLPCSPTAARQQNRARNKKHSREDHMRRLWLVALAALSAAAALPAKAQVSDDVVKIGVLTDMSGPSSAADG